MSGHTPAAEAEDSSLVAHIALQAALCSRSGPENCPLYWHQPLMKKVHERKGQYAERIVNHRDAGCTGRPY